MNKGQYKDDILLPPPFKIALRQFRKRYKLTQTHLAAFSGISSDTISNIERGLTNRIRITTHILIKDFIESKAQSEQELRRSLSVTHEGI